jgi:hypothetical protein
VEEIDDQEQYYDEPTEIRAIESDENPEPATNDSQRLLENNLLGENEWARHE